MSGILLKLFNMVCMGGLCMVDPCKECIFCQAQKLISGFDTFQSFPEPKESLLVAEKQFVCWSAQNSRKDPTLQSGYVEEVERTT